MGPVYQVKPGEGAEEAWFLLHPSVQHCPQRHNQQAREDEVEGRETFTSKETIVGRFCVGVGPVDAHVHTCVGQVYVQHMEYVTVSVGVMSVCMHELCAHICVFVCIRVPECV